MSKKTKGGSRKKGATNTKGKRGPAKQRTEETNAQQQQQQQNPYDRVSFVRPLWETLVEEKRVGLLTVKLEDVRARAKEQSDKAKAQGQKNNSDESQLVDIAVEEILEEGLKRLKEQGNWKVWRWGEEGKDYTDAEAFRQEAEEEHISEDLRKLLPRDEGKPIEKPAEAALRERMTNLLSQIHVQLQNAQDAWRRGQRNTTDQVETVVRDGNIDLVIAILEALQQEHHCLYQTILTPVTDFVCSQLANKSRKSSRSELFFEDLEKLPPEEVARLYEWLTEKVDSLCAKLKPDPKEEEVEEEETVGDIDLFSLTPDGEALTVNPKWLHHLQERRLSEEGQPRKVKEGEDEFRVGLVLEWVYGSIVSTAEKARDGAKRPLGSWEPSIQQAHENLCTALRDQRDWEARSKKAKELLKSMLEARKEMADLAKNSEHTIPGTAKAREPDADTSMLPDELVVKVLKREELLTRAKLHVLQYERMMGDSQLRTLRAELMQVGATNGEEDKGLKGEPEFERLKRELDDVKNTPRGVEGTFRTAAEKERHRAQLADSLLEEQLEVQSAFREQGARLQGIYDKRQRTEIEMAKREQEISQLRNWQRNVNQLMGKFTTLMAAMESSAEDDGERTEAEAASKETDEKALEGFRATFHRDFKKQLYSDIDDTTFFNRIKNELKQVERRLEDGAVVLQHLEMFLINVACNDPGAAIGGLLVLPLLQERLDKEAMEFATHKASLAEEEILRMEQEENERMEADASKKTLKSKKSKEKLRREKERKASEQRAKEAAEKAELEEQNRRERERLEEERREREAKLEQLRREEEEMIEKRRQELLAEENGYWRMRMEVDDSAKATAERPAEAKEGPTEDDFQSVTNHRRRGHERWSSWGGNRSSGQDGSGRRGGSGHADGFQRRDSGGRQHRRNRSDADALGSRAGANSAREHTGSSSGPKATPRSQRQPMSARNHRNVQGDAPRSGSQNAWNHPRRAQKAGQHAGQPRPNAQRTAQPAAQNTYQPAKPVVEAPAPAAVASPATPAQPRQEPAPPAQSPAPAPAPTPAAPAPTAQSVSPNAPKKMAWVKGAIPASVIGKPAAAAAPQADPTKTTKKDVDNKPARNVSGSRSGGSVTTEVSVNSPVTPDATEADAPSIRSDSDGFQNVYAKTGNRHQRSLSQIKTLLPKQSEIQDLKGSAGSSPLQPAEVDSPEAGGFSGNGEQFFSMVQSVSAVEVEEETKEVSEAGSHAEDVDEASQASDFDDSGPECSAPPAAPVMMPPPMGPPPFGMPMGGPMGPMPGYHPSNMPWMRPMGAMGPGMRPMFPFMGPPPNFMGPPAGAPGPAPASAPMTSGAPPAPVSTPPNTPAPAGPMGPGAPGAPVRPPGPGGPMYFYPPHMMGPNGAPMMQPFMPMMPGQWVGFPMGPQVPPFMGPGNRQLKKFTLRPTAKEFIPPSMMTQGNADGGECERTIQEGSEEDQYDRESLPNNPEAETTCEVQDATKTISTAIELEA